MLGNLALAYWKFGISPLIFMLNHCYLRVIKKLVRTLTREEYKYFIILALKLFDPVINIKYGVA
jgi:hypothetical protein